MARGIFNFLALTLELLQLIPRGVFIGIGFHPFYCFLIGYLIFTSTFLPQFWVQRWWWPVCVGWPFCCRRSRILSPYDLALGMLGEASVSLWFLAMGLNVQRWKHRRAHEMRWWGHRESAFRMPVPSTKPAPPGILRHQAG